MTRLVIKLGETVKTIWQKVNDNFEALFTEAAKIENKVDKVAGKGLSENDYTTAEKTKLAGIATGAQVNVIESVKVDGAVLPVSEKSVNIDLSAYAKKSDVGSAYKYKGSKATVSALPTTDNEVGDVYNVEADGMNYAWDGTTWDALGSTVDLSEYVKAEAMNAALGDKVDKVTGKGLSTNDFTNEYKEKLDAVSQAQKFTFTTSSWGSAVEGYMSYTVAAGGKNPVKVMRQDGDSYTEAVVDVSVNAANIILRTEEAFAGYVVAI